MKQPMKIFHTINNLNKDAYNKAKKYKYYSVEWDVINDQNGEPYEIRAVIEYTNKK